MTQETAFFRTLGDINTQVWCSSYYTAFLCLSPKGNVFGNLLCFGNLRWLDQTCRITCKSQTSPVSTETSSPFSVSAISETHNKSTKLPLPPPSLVLIHLREIRSGNYYAKVLISNYKNIYYLKFDYKSEMAA